METSQLHTSLHFKTKPLKSEKFLTVHNFFWQSKWLVVSEWMSSACEKAPTPSPHTLRPQYIEFSWMRRGAYNQNIQNRREHGHPSG